MCAPTRARFLSYYAADVCAGNFATPNPIAHVRGPDSVLYYCYAACSAPGLTLLAPGVDITAAGVTLSGTSQATPHASAALALLRSRHPSYTLAQIVSKVTSTGVMVSPHALCSPSAGSCQHLVI